MQLNNSNILYSCASLYWISFDILIWTAVSRFRASQRQERWYIPVLCAGGSCTCTRCRMCLHLLVGFTTSCECIVSLWICMVAGLCGHYPVMPYEVEWLYVVFLEYSVSYHDTWPWLCLLYGCSHSSQSEPHKLSICLFHFRSSCISTLR